MMKLPIKTIRGVQGGLKAWNILLTIPGLRELTIEWTGQCRDIANDITDANMMCGITKLHLSNFLLDNEVLEKVMRVFYRLDELFLQVQHLDGDEYAPLQIFDAADLQRTLRSQRATLRILTLSEVLELEHLGDESQYEELRGKLQLQEFVALQHLRVDHYMLLGCADDESNDLLEVYKWLPPSLKSLEVSFYPCFPDETSMADFLVQNSIRLKLIAKMKPTN